MPFDNAVVRLTLTGRDLRRVAEQAGPRYYFAGLRVTFEDAGGGRRASSLTIDGHPVQEDAVYSLATNDFLAEGGDGFLMLGEMPREAVGITVLDAVVRRLRELPAPVRLVGP
jgi:2',3'-cyclic-nucleotide 2'-phosphodiesterase (5'-nucleotidase family)